MKFFRTEATIPKAPKAHHYPLGVFHMRRVCSTQLSVSLVHESPVFQAVVGRPCKT